MRTGWLGSSAQDLVERCRPLVNLPGPKQYWWQGRWVLRAISRERMRPVGRSRLLLLLRLSRVADGSRRQPWATSQAPQRYGLARPSLSQSAAVRAISRRAVRAISRRRALRATSRGSTSRHTAAVRAISRRAVRAISRRRALRAMPRCSTGAVVYPPKHAGLKTQGKSRVQRSLGGRHRGVQLSRLKLLTICESPGAGSLAAGRPAPGHIPEVADIAAAASCAMAAAGRPGAAPEDEDDASDVDASAPPFGCGRRGLGPPLSVGRGAKKREFQDGGGLCSPGLWPPEKRRCGAVPSQRRCSPTVLPSACATGPQRQQAQRLIRTMRSLAIATDLITHSATHSLCDGPAAPAGMTGPASAAGPCHRAGCVHR